MVTTRGGEVAFVIDSGGRSLETLSVSSDAVGAVDAVAEEAAAEA